MVASFTSRKPDSPIHPEDFARKSSLSEFGNPFTDYPEPPQLHALARPPVRPRFHVPQPLQNGPPAAPTRSPVTAAISKFRDIAARRDRPLSDMAMVAFMSAAFAYVLLFIFILTKYSLVPK